MSYKKLVLFLTFLAIPLQDTLATSLHTPAQDKKAMYKKGRIIDFPFLVQPENIQPENIQPENVQPENVQPENVQPENVQPENVQPENVQPENIQPENVQPENIRPEPTQDNNYKKAEDKPANADPIPVSREYKVWAASVKKSQEAREKYYKAKDLKSMYFKKNFELLTTREAREKLATTKEKLEREEKIERAEEEECIADKEKAKAKRELERAEEEERIALKNFKIISVLSNEGAIQYLGSGVLASLV